MGKRDTRVEIGPVGPEGVDEALGLVFGHLSEQDRRIQIGTVRAKSTSAGAIDGLLAARRGGRLAGVVLCRVQPGGHAVIHPPRTVPGESHRIARRLLQAVCSRLRETGTRFVMVLADASMSERETKVLTRCGFEPLAELRYLVCFEEQFPVSRPEGPLEFEAYRPQSHERLKRVVAATYEGTLDCPLLNGVQRVDDVLAGYRATGVFDPARWLIARHGDTDVGCLLLADHPDQGNMELVYMGVVPEWRGRGWGAWIARHAQWLTRLAGRSQLVAAVDTANPPGVSVYAGVGFEAWDLRRVFWRVFDKGS